MIKPHEIFCVVIAILFTSGCQQGDERSQLATPGEGFTLICDVFTQAQADNDTSVEKLDKELTALTDSLGETSPAAIAWTAIRSAVAEQRYRLFKSAATETLNSGWDCPAMQDLAGKL